METEGKFKKKFKKKNQEVTTIRAICFGEPVLLSV